MKTLLIAMFLVLPLHELFSQGTYSAQLVIDDIFWKNGNEWEADVHVAFFDYGQPQSPPMDATYVWWTQIEVPNGPWQILSQGVGQYTSTPDNHHDDVTKVYVVITLASEEEVTSNTINIVKTGDPQLTSLYAQKQDGTSLTGFSNDSIGLWTDYSWREWRGPGTTVFMSDGEVLKVKPNIQSLGEKFHRGESFAEEVTFLNYDNYPIYYDATPNQLTMHHRQIYDATVSAILADDPSSPISAQFKDPWLEDELGFGGEYKSRGMIAPFNSVTPGQYNVGINTSYKGVFLGQTVQSGNYYSVRVPLTINGLTYHVLSWQSTNATLTSETGQSGYEQKAVVFTDDEATVTAKLKAYHATSYAAGTGYNNQRKLAVHTQGVNTFRHMVYESGGDIWYSVSVNGSGRSNEIWVV